MTNSFIQLARLELDFERSKSPSFSYALSAYRKTQFSRFSRIGRIGFSANLRLTRAELACAKNGLFFEFEENQDCVPWRLPDDFLGKKVVDLPNHPLINNNYLSKILGRDCSCESAIAYLTNFSDITTRMGNLPIFGITPSTKRNSVPKVAICLHLFYPELWPFFKKQLLNIPEAWDLYISTPFFACTKTLETIIADHENTVFFLRENRGRDVLPFIDLIGSGVLEHYDAVLKIHGKRSLHMSGGDRWLEEILKSLVQNPEKTMEILSRFRTEHDLGMIGPNAYLIESGHLTPESKNREIVYKIGRKMSLPDELLDSPFFAGTMFWVRPAALHWLRKNLPATEDFALEMGQTDGTAAHALERLFCALIQKSGYKFMCA